MVSSRVLLLLLPFLAVAASSAPAPAAVPAPAPGKAACSLQGGSGTCAEPEEGGEAKALRTLEAYTALLEEKLQQHERHQREQQKNTLLIFCAIGLCVVVVLIIALAVCKVYVRSLQEQLQCVPHEQQGQQQPEQESDAESVATIQREPAVAAGLQHRRRVQHGGQKASYLSRASHLSGSATNRDTHGKAAFLEAVDGESSDDQEIRLWPSREEVGM